MLEQIHAPSEDGRKVQLFVSACTAVFGFLVALSGGLVVPPAAAVGASVALAGLAGAVMVASRAPRPA